MKLYGVVEHNRQRGHWCVKLRWQGGRHYFSQIPTRGDEWLPCTSEAMALHLQREISREIDRAVFAPARWKKNRPMRLRAWAATWLERQQHLRDITLAGYRSAITHHILPHLGDKFVGDISSADYVDLYNALELAPKSKKNVFICLFSVMEDARRANLIEQVPERLRFVGPRSIPRKEIQWLDVETHARIMAEIPAGHRPIFQFLFLTGVRPSEARALRWRDIKADHIIIAQTFTQAKGGMKIEVPKNRKAQPIPLYESVRELLETVPRRLTEYVFVNYETGQPYSFSFNRIWRKACKSVLGYTIRLNNAGRHSFANNLLAGGVPLETVSRLLRHSSTEITEEHYGRPHLNVMKRAVDNVQRIR